MPSIIRSRGERPCRRFRQFLTGSFDSVAKCTETTRPCSNPLREMKRPVEAVELADDRATLSS